MTTDKLAKHDHIGRAKGALSNATHRRRTKSWAGPTTEGRACCCELVAPQIRAPSGIAAVPISADDESPGSVLSAAPLVWLSLRRLTCRFAPPPCFFPHQKFELLWTALTIAFTFLNFYFSLHEKKLVGWVNLSQLCLSTPGSMSLILMILWQVKDHEI